jgi:hypothetical protein
MDFVRSYFGKNEPLTSWTLNPAKKWGKKCSTGQRFIFTEVTSYQIHTLVSSLLPLFENRMATQNKLQMSQILKVWELNKRTLKVKQ